MLILIYFFKTLTFEHTILVARIKVKVLKGTQTEPQLFELKCTDNYLEAFKQKNPVDKNKTVTILTHLLLNTNEDKGLEEEGN